jgi:hypothetical protein
MKAQHHFIIQYDNEANTKWSWSVETEQAKFDGKAIYLPEKNEWVGSSYTTDINELDNELSDMLGSAIHTLNTVVRKDY